MKLARIVLLFCAALPIFAQFGPEVTISQLPAPNPGQIIYGYTGANLVYACYSRSSWELSAGGITAISAATNANPVVFTSTAHGLALNSRPLVVITGGTGNWTAVNSTPNTPATATVIDANTFSIPVNSTAFGAVTGTLTFRSTAPRTNQKQWAVKLYAYDASNNLISSMWLNGSPVIGSSRCSGAAGGTVNVQ